MANEVAKEAEIRKLKIEFHVIEGVLAFNDLMSRTEPKGRSEMRNHSKLFREFNANCKKYKDDGSKTEYTWQLGTLEYTDEAAIEYFIQVLEKRIETGIPGQLSVGFAELLEATDRYKDAKKKA